MGKSHLLQREEKRGKERNRQTERHTQREERESERGGSMYNLDTHVIALNILLIHVPANLVTLKTNY